MARQTSGGAGGYRPKPPPSFAQSFMSGLRTPKPKTVKQPKLKFAKPKQKAKPKVQVRQTTGAPIARTSRAPIVTSHVPSKPPASGPPVPRRGTSRAPKRVAPVGGGGGAQQVSAQTAEQQYIDASLAPVLQQLKDQQTQDQAAEQQRRDALQQLTGQWLQYVSQIPGQVGADYTQGIQQQQQIGQEAMQALQAANPNAVTQADLRAIGAPQAQQDAVAAQNQVVFGGGGALLNGLAGLNAQGLSRGQQAQLTYAQSLPAVANAAATQSLNQFNRLAQDAQTKRDAQLAEIMAQVPKMRLDYQQQATAAQQKQDYMNFLQGKFGVQTAQANRRLNIQATTANNNANLRYAEVYGYNPKTGQPTLAALKAARADKAKGNKPPSATALKNWNQYAEDAFYGVAQKERYDTSTGTWMKVPGTGKPPTNYYPALKKLMAMGATLSQAQKILNALYAKGEGGRPYVSLQGRIALQKAGMPLKGTNSVPNAKQKKYLQARGLWSD